ncbi:Transcriptional regulator [Candidatus Syntrophocurvum alkaliphilum]|uniref:Transcriptional regulator n=1 Tax=Candidatus Syntrophocurvum alkaliphilum TaxID=2293317 RepID=A0A6I6DFM7_9FIRM|nr:nickel-dependent lactate racemase [Candidatus Syntrophocurvum alkaliphilum]QGT99414.1 Transcriptional regulator [Candidatus Syntrophocurvum alkaliphilum]
MKYSFAYGETYKSFEINKINFLGELKANDFKNVIDENDLIESALNNPINSDSLQQIINKKKAENVVIVVNDITRPTPYKKLLPPMLKKIENAGISKNNIKLIIATGIHRPHTKEDNINVFGEEICTNYNIINHNPDKYLKDLGYLSNGMKLVINRHVAEADILITTGIVTLHYFAGFSGGRKSILPGVAGRDLIKENHKMMSDKRACLGNYNDNPVNDIMIEAARKVGVDYILNIVTAQNNNIIHCTSGDLYEAWINAVKFCEHRNVVEISEPADIVIAGCGGYPKDINMYQAQKALDSAVLAVKNGGSIILVAECREGLGETTFANWIENAISTEDIKKRFFTNFELGGHKAFAISRILEKANVYIISNLEDNVTKKLNFISANSVNEALSLALQKHGINSKIYLIPEAPQIAVKHV